MIKKIILVKRGTYKRRCLRAVRILIKEYKLGIHQATYDGCELCQIFNKSCIENYYNHKGCSCPGCPNTAFENRFASKHTFNCQLRKTFPSIAYGSGHSGTEPAAQEFWEKAYPVLYKMPRSCFNPKTSKKEDFFELIAIDDQVRKSFKI